MSGSIHNIAFNYSATSASGRTATVAIGDPIAGRWIVPIVFMQSQSATRTVQTCTVNGFDAFLSASQVNYGSGTDRVSVFIGKPVYVPDGTTVDIGFTASNTYQRSYIGAVATLGLTAQSTRRLVGYSGTDTAPAGVTIDTFENGLTFASIFSIGTPAFSWSGVDALPAYNGANGATASSYTRASLRGYAGRSPAETAHPIVASMDIASIFAMAAVSYSFDDNSATPTTLTVVDLLNNRVVQRVAGTNASHPIKVKATYTGTSANTPTLMQARVMKGATVVMDWTTVGDLVVGGGIITATVTGVPKGSGYVFEFRTYAGSTLLATAAGANVFHVGDLIGVWGSSTSALLASFEVSSVPVPANVFAMSIDTNGVDSWAAPVGAGYRGIGAKLIANDPTTPIGILDLAFGGSKVDEWVGSSPQRSRFTNYIKAGEGKIWAMVNAYLAYATVTSIETQASKMQGIISTIRTELGQPSLPLFMCVGSPTSNSPSASDDLASYREIESFKQIVAADPLTTLGSNRDLQAGNDLLHMDGPSLTIAGRRIGYQMVTVLRGVTRPYKCPAPVSAAYNATDGSVIISFDLQGNGSLIGKTGPTNITGFRASSDGFATLLTISSATIVAPDKVRLVIAEQPPTVQIDYAYKHQPDNTNPLLSNSGASL